MSDTVPTPPPLAALPRGWYVDPQDPSLDRWWDGTFWTSYTHRSASLRRSMFGPEYARSFWAGPNRAAGRSLLFSRIAMGALALAVILTATLISAGDRHANPTVAAILDVLVVGASVLSIAGIVMGGLGAAAAGRLGARVLAIWGLCASAVAALISVPIAVFLLV